MGFNPSILFFALLAGCFAGVAYAGRFKLFSLMPDKFEDNTPTAPVSPDTTITTRMLNNNNWKISNPFECARECKNGEPPKMCYYSFTVEYYATMTHACDLCRPNETLRFINDCDCIMGDGFEVSGIMTVNRMYPGPSIVVCENDYVIVDVVNTVPGNGITIHWHGLQQRSYQYYDGVPFVTQCPIDDDTTFRYQFRVHNSGTHFWHAHTGLHEVVGLVGPVIVREPKVNEPFNQLWDIEDSKHIIFVTDWFHHSAEEHFPGMLKRRPGQLPDNFLINGMGMWTDPDTKKPTNAPLAVFTVKAGRRYRFRMINGCMLACPVTITIEGHILTIIATDGEPVQPVNVTSINSFSAERFDFVLNAWKKAGDYWIQVRGAGECLDRKIQQLAILRYDTSGQYRMTAEPTYDNGLTRGLVLNDVNVRCDDPSRVNSNLCITDLQSVEPIPSPILNKKADIQIYLSYGFHGFTSTEIYKPNVFNKFLVNLGGEFTSVVNNISNVFPQSSLISQRDDISADTLCNPFKMPNRCRGANPCYCAHIYDLPINKVVELILVDESPVSGLSHPLHLHGYAFHVFKDGYAKSHNMSRMSVEALQDLDKRGLLVRKMTRPPAKDTMALPNNGYAVVRFLTNNPGYWLFHCHFLPHLISGMSVIFHVGGPEHLPPVPDGFPKCGNFVPMVQPVD